MKPVSDYTKAIAAILSNVIVLFGLDKLELAFITPMYVNAAAVVINGIFVYALRNTKNGKPI